MNETNLFNRFKRVVPGTSSRMENTVGTGMFDVNYLQDGVESWCELKVLKGVRDPKIIIRGRQVAWAKKRYEHKAANLFFMAANDNEAILWKASAVIKSIGPETKFDERGHYHIPVKDLPVMEHGPIKPLTFKNMAEAMYTYSKMSYSYYSNLTGE